MAVEQEFAHLPALPIVPWAVTLAMTVAYREFRVARVAARRNQSKRDCETACTTLEKLSDQWWTAEAMAKLGRKAVATFEGISCRKYLEETVEKRCQTCVDGFSCTWQEQQGGLGHMMENASAAQILGSDGGRETRALEASENRPEQEDVHPYSLCLRVPCSEISAKIS
jgi:hypothetical protein